MARKTRSAADIARSRARKGRSSLQRSEPPKRNKRKKDRKTSTPPRRARARKPSKTRKKPKKAAARTRSLSREKRSGSGLGRLLLLVAVMMGLGFGLVWGLDAWARLSRPAPSARVEAAPVVDAETEPAGVGLAQLWEKFVDRLLDRDLPVKNKPVLPAARKPKPAPAPAPAPPAAEPEDPSGRAETRAPPPTDYQAQSTPLQQAQERRVKRAQTRRERLDKLFDQVGLDR